MSNKTKQTWSMCLVVGSYWEGGSLSLWVSRLPVDGLVVLKPLDVGHWYGNSGALQTNVPVLNDGDVVKEVGVVNLWRNCWQKTGNTFNPYSKNWLIVWLTDWLTDWLTEWLSDQKSFSDFFIIFIEIYFRWKKSATFRKFFKKIIYRKKIRLQVSKSGVFAPEKCSLNWLKFRS